METANPHGVERKPFLNSFVWILILLVALTISLFFVGRKALTAPRGSAVKYLAEMQTLEPEAQQLAQLIVQVHSEYQRNTQMWSLGYHFFAFCAIALSAFAGVALKLESVIQDEKKKRDLAAVLAVLSAVLGTICMTGNFQRKWEANRIAAAHVEALAYDVMQRQYNVETALAALRGISLQRNLEIVSQEPPKVSGSNAVPGKAASPTVESNRTHTAGPTPK